MKDRTTENKEVWEAMKPLLKEYANAYYLVSEENHPEIEEEKALDAVRDGFIMSLHDREVLVREEMVQVLKANEEEFEAPGLEKDYIIGFKDGKNQAIQNIARVLEIDLSDNLTS